MNNYIFVTWAGKNKHQKTEKGSSDTASARGLRLGEAINRDTGKKSRKSTVHCSVNHMDVLRYDSHTASDLNPAAFQGQQLIHKHAVSMKTLDTKTVKIYATEDI